MAIAEQAKNAANSVKRALRNRRVSAEPTARERWKLQDGENRMRNNPISRQGTRHLESDNMPINERLTAYKTAKQQGMKKGSFEYAGRKNVLDRSGNIVDSMRVRTPKTTASAIHNPRTTANGGYTPKTTASVPTDPKTTANKFPSEGMPAKDWKGTLNDSYRFMKQNVDNHLAQTGGSYKSHFMRSAGQGAVWGGVVGGSVSAAQGGDFWQGAKEGAFKGAVGFSVAKTARIGSGARGYMDTLPAVKDAVQMHSSKAGVAKAAAGRMNNRVSKQATSIMQNRQGVAQAQQFMNNR